MAEGKADSGKRRVSLIVATIAVGAVLALALWLWVAWRDADQTVDHGLPATKAAIRRAAVSEARLVIYSVTERPKVERLLADFQRTYPGITVDYVTLSAAALYQRTIAESGRGRTADITWSSAMDLQIKLVNDGFAQPYASPERAALPRWARWKDEAWGVTAEPIVIAYNRALVPKADIPRTHEALKVLLERRGDIYRGRIATYDPLRSAVGYLYVTQDEQASHDTAALFAAMARSKAILYDSTEAMIRDLAAGEQWIAYNMIGSYALEQQARDGSVGIVLPEDYTLVMSRIALIPAKAQHPNAARLFLDFLLSRRGQGHLSAMYMNPVRRDVSRLPGLTPPAASARAIHVGPSLLLSLDHLKKQGFARRWERLQE